MCNYQIFPFLLDSCIKNIYCIKLYYYIFTLVVLTSPDSAIRLRQQNFFIYISRPPFQKYALLSSLSNCSYSYVLMIKICIIILILQDNLFELIMRESIFLYSYIYNIHKQPLRGVPRKRCSENMQQIYRRIPMLKCDFNKVAK